jgi:hypothetical protein
MYPQVNSERNGGFGRRAGPARPVYRADGNGESQDNPGGTSGADPMRKLILIVPLIVIVMGAVFVTVRLINAGAGSSGFQCRSNSGSVFDIDWCRAARAAVEGGARGMAGGAGARR